MLIMLMIGPYLIGWIVVSCFGDAHFTDGSSGMFAHEETCNHHKTGASHKHKHRDDHEGEQILRLHHVTTHQSTSVIFYNKCQV